MDEPETGSLERRVVAAIRADEFDPSAGSLDDLRERLAAETGSEAWAEENVAPFYLMGRVMAIHDRLAAVDGLPTGEQVEGWRSELDEAVGTADEAWGTPTVGIAEFVPEVAGELRSMLSTLATLVGEHRRHVADLGADDPLVERHGRLVREHVETTVRTVRALRERPLLAEARPALDAPHHRLGVRGEQSGRERTSSPKAPGSAAPTFRTPYPPMGTMISLRTRVPALYRPGWAETSS